MQSMGNWDYFAIVKELQPLVGAFFDKFYICIDGSSLLRLRKKGAINLVGNANKLHVVTNAPETLETPPQFVMVVRKWLENSTLQKVEQLNGDRIVSFSFQRKDCSVYKLVFELFAKGNMVLTNEDNKIVDVLKREEYADRKLKPREAYVVPPTKKSIEELQTNDFKPAGVTVAAIASVANIPPFYIEEAIARLKCNTDVKQLTEKEKTEIVAELKKIKTEFKPTIYLENGKPIAFSFTSLAKLSSLEKQECTTFSQALESYYSNASPDAPKLKKGKPDKISSRLEFQRKAVEEFKAMEKDNRERAELIYAKYPLFEEILQTAIKLIKEKKPVDKIEAKLIEIAKKNGEKAEIKFKNGKIEVTLSHLGG